MIYDIDTVEGMEKAKRWTLAFLDLIREGGSWGVPRSGTVYRFYKSKLLAVRLLGPGDESVERVLNELGYLITDELPTEH